ncbi:MAG TPA: carbamoyltransferase C-terminal domain-containing protein [Vicinamibacterales bacterium]|nr:carbamoyltransferase C-terminal domain-containing protein [Vicinamibacterales bacterium]
MNILGISALDKESTATVIRDGVVVASVSEERLTRVKQQSGFPARAVQSVLALSGLVASQIDRVAYPFFEHWHELRLLGANAIHDMGRVGEKVRHRGVTHALRHYAALGKTLHGFHGKLSHADRELARGLRDLGLTDRLCRYDHQLCHAASAYFTSGFDRCLVITLDWYGSGKAGSIYLGQAGKLELVASIPFPNSVGILYSSVTAALGFVPDRHEGKIVGLAAYGDAARVAPAVMSRFAERVDGYDFLDPLDSTNVDEIATTHSREDVSAGHQRALELVVLRTIRHYLKVLRVSDIAAAGGVFANVKMNQRIVEMPEVTGLFVHPAMSDMGTGTGAAMVAAIEAGDLREPSPIQSVFLGPSYDDRAIESALAGSGFRYSKMHDVAGTIAGLIADNRLVGRFTGRMEYGPRALGNRSVLANAFKPTVTEALNQRLQRNDFMPFAPATLERAATRCYHESRKVLHTARFMTVCLPCTDVMKELSPAAVHVDGTARPQFVSEESNADLFAILEEVEKRTGAPSVINTSFNIHEEPIVCSPADAIRAFHDGRLDYLALESFLVEPHE